MSFEQYRINFCTQQSFRCCAFFREGHNRPLEHQSARIMVTTPKKPKLKSDIRDVLGRQVRKLRTEAGFSQEELATQCDIFRTYLSRIENGSANPTIDVVAALAAALKVDVRELFNE